MLNINNLKFEKLDLEHIKILVKWAENEGWNPGCYDADVFWKTDPDGFWGYFKNNELIAGGSIVSYNKEFGFMGFFIVKPQYRNCGIGKKLWYLRKTTLLKRLNKGASIGMDGVVAMQPFYSKGGFKIAFKDERYERLGATFKVNASITSIGINDMNSILLYDKKCFGFSRSQFIKLWVKLPETKTFKYTENGALKGFAIIRKVIKGYKVCPLFADNAFIAESLYKACLNSIGDEVLYIDIPTINKDAVTMIKKYEAKYVFECARMYLGEPPKIEMDKVYGITTFELG